MIESWTCLLQVFPSEKHTISSDNHKLVAPTKRLGASGLLASGTETSDDGKRGQITEELTKGENLRLSIHSTLDAWEIAASQSFR